jgi:alkaline phosphatase
MSQNHISRRELLRRGGGALLVGAAAASTSADPKPRPSASGSGAPTPRNVILMVSDGMSMGVPTLALSLSEQQRGRPTAWAKLMRDPDAVHGLLATQSRSSMVTDSSAASSAWGSGVRVANGSVNVLPDGTRLTPIAPLLREKGIRVGLITTDVAVGGTPAGFGAVRKSRSDYYGIARDFLDRIDVLLGGGRAAFDPAMRRDEADLISAYQAFQYGFVEDRTSLNDATPQDRLLGLFAREQLPFTIDTMHDAALDQQIPTLAEMTAKGLACLSRSSEGFFAMIEGARIDHAAHANDAAGAIWDQIAFDDAVAVALDFARENGETLLIVTSDHGNANPGLNGTGSRYMDSTPCFDRLAGVKASFGRIRQRVVELASQGSMADGTIEAIRETTGMTLSAEDAAIVGDALIHKSIPAELNHQHRNWVGLLGQVLGNHLGIGWTGVSHTSDHVLLSAYGPGSNTLQGLHHHTEIFDQVTHFFGAHYENPGRIPFLG